MKDILKGKSFKEMKDETVSKVEDFMDEHYVLVTCATGAIVGSFTALCMCNIYKNAYGVGVNDGLDIYNHMINQLANMYKESK